MNHNDIRHKLSEYIDNTLRPGERASVEEHLKTCADCGNALVELQKTVEHIKELEEVEPPAWMAGKIMARTRAEEEKKKQGVFNRLFFPLHIKLPLETVGVLFIAATVYFVVQEMPQTQQHFPEAPPVQTYSPESSPKDSAPKESKAAKPEDSLQRHKVVPQEPEYKALDMKPAYEEPQPPQPAPAPPVEALEQDQRSLKYEPSISEKSTGASSPGFMGEQAAPAKRFSDRETAPQAQADMAKKKSERSVDEMKAAAAPEGLETMIVTLAVSDVDSAAARVEKSAGEYGGKITRNEPVEGTRSISVMIMNAERRNSFIDRLKTLGEMKVARAGKNNTGGTVLEIRISIHGAAPSLP